jgi:hypothetical protein
VKRTAPDAASGSFCCEWVTWSSPRRIVFVENYQVQAIDIVTRKLVTLVTGSEVYALSRDGKTVALKVGCDCGHSPNSISISSIDGRRTNTVRSAGHPTPRGSPTAPPRSRPSTSTAAASTSGTGTWAT